MKIEVNDYVRTKDGKIEKYSGTNDSEIENFTLNEIVKCSSNIIDLIEVGDYVNGYLVLSVGTITWDSNGNPINRAVLINHLGSDLWLGEEFIRNVLTHEQVEKWMYKIGDINE